MKLQESQIYTYKKVLYFADPLYAMAENLGTCQGEGNNDGGHVRHAERSLRPEASQGLDDADGIKQNGAT